MRALVRRPDDERAQALAQRVRSCGTATSPTRRTLDGAFADVEHRLLPRPRDGRRRRLRRARARRRTELRPGRRRAGVERVVYLGGLGDESASKHLRSRHATALALATPGPAADLLQGRDGRRRRQRVLPHAPLPGQKAAGDDRAALAADRHAADRHRRRRRLPRPRAGRPRVEGREVQIGGPDVLSYGDMLDRMADAMGVRPARRCPSRFSRPGSPPLWLGLVTPVDTNVARPLVEGLRTDDGGDRQRAGRRRSGSTGVPFDEALRRALREEQEAGSHSARGYGAVMERGLVLFTATCACTTTRR